MCLVRESFCWPGAHSLNIDQTTQQPIDPYQTYISKLSKTLLARHSLHISNHPTIYPSVAQKVQIISSEGAPS